MQFVFPTVLLGLLTVLILWGMWATWSKRAKKDKDAVSALQLDDALVGKELALFQNVQYVSTTISGSALERVQIPGLRYRGFADITVTTDGIRVQVRGEKPVCIRNSLVLETGTTQMRIGKVVERGGLAGLVWKTETQKVESAFRFSSTAEQKEFMKLVNQKITQLLETAGEN